MTDDVREKQARSYELEFIKNSSVSSIVELMFINEIEGMNNIHTHTYIYIGEEREGRTKREIYKRERDPVEGKHHPLTSSLSKFYNYDILFEY